MKPVVVRVPGASPVFAMVDDGDYARVVAKKWTLWGGYAVGNFQHPTRRRHRLGKGSDRKPTQIGMHRFILGLETGEKVETDHRNGDRLDNQRSNLRILTRAENAQNRLPNKPTRHSQSQYSQYRGVHWDPSAKKWKAVVRGKRIGQFSSEEEAHVAAWTARKATMPFSEHDKLRRTE